MDLLQVTMIYGRSVVFIRLDSAEIFGFRYGLTLVIGTLKFMARTGVFARVISSLKHSIKSFPSRPKHDFDLNEAQIKPQPPKHRL
jgi:hypothetical protein